MKRRVTQSDSQLLSAVAEHVVLTVRQLSAILSRNLQSVGRRLRNLAAKGLVRLEDRQLAGGPGRPEKVVWLSEAGREALASAGASPKTAATDRPVSEPTNCLEHQLLIGDFRVQLAQMHRLIPAVTVRFLSRTSLGGGTHGSAGSAAVARSGKDGGTRLVPDGVFVLTHASVPSALLFFLEADCGTEALISRSGRSPDVRRKIAAYQACFQGESYKQYEKLWDCRLRGFRVLFVTTEEARAAALCGLIRRHPRSDFFWVAPRQRMLSCGVWAAIWARGGRTDRPAESILGTKMPDPAPRPDTVP